MAQQSTWAARAAPLSLIAAGLAVGIFTDHYAALHEWFYVTVFVAAGALLCFRRIGSGIGWVLIVVASVAAGGTLNLRLVRAVSPLSIEHHATVDGRIARITGTVVSEPRIVGLADHPFRPWKLGQPQSVFLFDVNSIEANDGYVVARGLLRVSVGELLLDLHNGERVTLFGRLYLMQPPRNPGAFDWRTYQRARGVVAGMRCKHRENVVRLNDAVANRDDANEQAPKTNGILASLRAGIGSLLIDDLAAGPEEVSLLEAMVLGQRSRVDRRLSNAFLRAGCIHFLAVSGLHVGIVMSLIWLPGRLLGIGRRSCAWLMAIAIVAYVLIAEPRVPILRAGIMGVLFSVSLMFRRSTARMNWLAAAAVILLVINPSTLFDIGFQLSFTAVIGVVYLGPALRRLFFTGAKWIEKHIFGREYAEEDRRLMKPPSNRPGTGRHRPFWLATAHSLFVLAFWVSLGAWLVTLPIVAYHFQRVQLWGAVSSVVVFLFVWILIAVGLFKVLVGTLIPPFGLALGVVLSAVGSLLIRIVDFFSGLPGATVDVPRPPLILMGVYYLVLFLCAVRFSGFPEKTRQREAFPWERPTRRPPRWLAYSLAGSIGTLLVGVMLWLQPAKPSGRLVITALSVGAGSVTVIELPEGGTVLVDAGATTSYGIGRSVVVPFLKTRGITRIDRVYITHANLDHFSAVPTIIDEMPTGPIIFNEYFKRRSPPRSPSRHLLKLLADRNHPMQVTQAGHQSWELGGATFEMLWPQGPMDHALTTNDTSTVLRISFGGHAILLAGDIEDRAQRKLLSIGGMATDVLVLPHHGSVRSSTAEFLDNVNADILVRSSSQRMANTTNGLVRLIGSTPTYNTADVGAVEIVIDRDGVRVSSMLGTGFR